MTRRRKIGWPIRLIAFGVTAIGATVAYFLRRRVRAKATGAVIVEGVEERTIPADGAARLRVHHTSGRVEVAGTDGATEVRVIARKRVRAATREIADDVLRHYRVRAATSGASLDVWLDQPLPADGFAGTRKGHAAADLVVLVPAGLDVSVDVVSGSVTVRDAGSVETRTRNGALHVCRAANVEAETTNGAIEIEAARGTVHATTRNGPIWVTSVRGGVIATSRNGEIRCRLERIAQGVDVGTRNGAVKIDLPADAAATLDLRTTAGHIGIEGFAVGALDRERIYLRGTIGGGGPSLRASTVNGAITVSAR